MHQKFLLLCLLSLIACSSKDDEPTITFPIPQEQWVRLTNHSAEDFHPSFSPDGQRVLFDSNREGHHEVYTVKTDGTDLQRLTQGPTIDNDHPRWSPDGTHIVFESDQGNSNVDLYSMNADGSGPQTIDFKGSAGWCRIFIHPMVLALLISRFKNDVFDLYVMNVDGSNDHRLTQNQVHDFGQVWSPDGLQLASCARENGTQFEIYSMPQDGSQQAIHLSQNAAEDEEPHLVPGWRENCVYFDTRWQL
jgi:TolB protein